MSSRRTNPSPLTLPSWSSGDSILGSKHARGSVLARPSPWRTTAALVTADVAAIAASTVVALWLSSGVRTPDELSVLLKLLPLLAVLPLGFAALGLYPAAGTGPVEEMRRLLVFTSSAHAAVMAVLALAFDIGLGTVAYVVVSWLATSVLVPMGRSAVRHVCARRPWWGVPVIVVGAGKTAQLVISRLRTFVGLNLRPVAALDDDPNKLGTHVIDVPVVGALQDAPSVKRAWRSDYAIVAMPGVDADRLGALVHRIGRTFSNVVVIPNAFGMTSIGVGTRDSGGIVGLHVVNHLTIRRNRLAKRVFDLVMLVPLSVVALPAIVVSALAVFVVSPGNPFYRQEREGYDGKPIRIWKLRTMRRDADEALRRHLDQDPEARKEWTTYFKLANDPRVLPGIGKILRRLSLDELPQLANIAKGELSFVGPRPFPYYHLEQFDDGFRTLRTSVVPGLTGYWQVTSRSTADLVAQVELDSYYIKNWSLWLDLYVLARTPWAVFFGPGAY